MIANPGADEDAELFLSESTRISIWRSQLKMINRRLKSQVGQVVRGTNQMLKMHHQIWKFGGSMPHLSILDRNGKLVTIADPEPWYTFLNFCQTLEYQHFYMEQNQATHSTSKF